MKCRFCGTELPKGAKECPGCGKKLGLNTLYIVLLSVAALLVVFALTIVVMKDQGVDLGWLDPATWFQKAPEEEPDKTPAAEEPEGETEDMEYLYEFELTRDNFTVTGDALEGKADLVVATMDGVELTNGELQVYYRYGISQYEQSLYYYYGVDLSYLGLDTSKPFEDQMSMDGENNWQVFFLQAALSEWHKYAALAQEAKKAGHEMSQEATDAMNEYLAQMEANRAETGYETVDALLKAELSPLCSEENYRAYLYTYFYALDYFETQYDAMEPTDQEAEAYFQENEGSLSFTKDDKKHNVRHILIEPQGGTTDASGYTTYTEEEMAVCKEEARKILDSWDGTEEGFAKLAKEYSADPGSAENGGMYEELTASTNFVTEFKEWYLDKNRQPGDTGLVRSSYGYHIMFYSSGTTIWQEQCKALIWQEKSDEFTEKIMAAWPVTLREENIALAQAEQAS